MLHTYHSLVTRLFEEVWNKKQLQLIDEIFSEDFLLHAGDSELKGRSNIHNLLQEWQTAFPDIHHTVEDIVQEDDKVVVRWKGEGTQKGPFSGLLPTGNKMQYRGITLFKVSQNHFCECWIGVNLLELMDHLKVFSKKTYSESDFCVDFAGPAGPIYKYIMKARRVPSCSQAIANALRELYLNCPLEGLPPPPQGLFEQTEKKEILIDATSGEIHANIYSPKQKESELLPTILYLYGGGWIMGSSAACELICRKLALTSHSIVICPTYRLAPEAPYPSALDDCASVLSWTKQSIDQFGGQNDWIALAGDSAGGNLAAALTLKEIDSNGIIPSALLLLTPVTDLYFEKYESFNRLAPKGLIVDGAMLDYMRSAYASADKWQQPYVSPMYGDLHDFCPTFILAATEDPFQDDNILFAQKLKESDNQEVELFIAKDMPHGYYYFIGVVGQVEELFDGIAKFLTKVQKPLEAKT